MPAKLVENGTLADLFAGKLVPDLLLISDSIVQPGHRLLREIVRSELSRNASLCLVCTESLPSRLLPRDDLHFARTSVIDCTGLGRPSNAGQKHLFGDVTDLAGLESHVRAAGDALIVIDGLTTLETFNDSANVYSMLKRFLLEQKRLILLRHDDISTSPQTDFAISLLPSLASPSFSSSYMQLVLHSPNIFAHLHRVYGIEQVGQNDGTPADIRIYQYLSSLRQRQWASPFTVGELNGASEQQKLSGDNSQYDSSRGEDVQLDLLASSASSGMQGGRCVVEYTMRGIKKATKGSEAAKITRGIEGLVRTVPDDRVQAVPVHQVLRIKRQVLQAVDVAPAAAMPSSQFNLGTTDRQKQERDAMVLPYAAAAGHGQILYQPDSGDDLDSDPDEDLEF